MKKSLVLQITEKPAPNIQGKYQVDLNNGRKVLLSTEAVQRLNERACFRTVEFDGGALFAYLIIDVIR